VLPKGIIYRFHIEVIVLARSSTGKGLGRIADCKLHIED
jgi:hypothetical protein